VGKQPRQRHHPLRLRRNERHTAKKRAVGIRSRAVRSRSAVGFAAVFDGSDANGVFVFMEAHVLVADAEAELGRLDDVLEMLDVARASVQIAGQPMEDAESSGLIDGARS
jgi:hypothetical protein